MSKSIDLRSRLTLWYQHSPHFLHVGNPPLLCHDSMDKVLSGRSAVSGVISPRSHLSSQRFIGDAHRLFRRDSGERKKKTPQNIEADAHEARPSISTSAHVALQQIDSLNAGIVLTRPPVHTFWSGHYGAPRSIYTPLEGADEREERQQKEKRKTRAGAKGEKISSQNQTAAGYQEQRWRCVCLSLCVVGCVWGRMGWVREFSGGKLTLLCLDIEQHLQKPSVPPLCDKKHSKHEKNKKLLMEVQRQNEHVQSYWVWPEVIKQEREKKKDRSIERRKNCAYNLVLCFI